jgi:hypothetical protein
VAVAGFLRCDPSSRIGIGDPSVFTAAASTEGDGASSTAEVDADRGATTLLIYNDIVKGGDRALPWEARAIYEQGLRHALEIALGEELEEATMVRATSSVELERLVRQAAGDRLIYYGHMVGPYSARRVSPTGQLRGGIPAATFGAWLPEKVTDVEVIGCRSESFARELVEARPDLTVRTMGAVMNLFDWVDPDDPGNVRVWESPSHEWTGLPTRTERFVLVTISGAE